MPARRLSAGRRASCSGRNRSPALLGGEGLAEQQVLGLLFDKFAPFQGEQAAAGGAVDQFSQIEIGLLGVKPGDEFATVLVQALVGVQGAQIRTGRGGDRKSVV